MDFSVTALTALTTIPSIQESVSKTICTFQNILSHQYADKVKQELHSLDVVGTIASIEKVIQSDEMQLMSSHFSTVCVERIHFSIKKIHELLTSVETKLNEYQNSWIKWTLGMNVFYEIQELKNEKAILNTRIDTLIQMFMLHKLTVVSQKDS